MVADSQLIAGRYRLESLLGRGGMGQVWRARDEVLQRAVAVKEVRFPPDIAETERDALRERLMREARLTARLNHPGITTTYDVVSQDGRPFIVMELVEARSLADEISQRTALPVRRVAEIGLRLLDALGAAHRETIVHRDVKPSNVLLAHDGRVVLTDFGIATAETDPSLTSTGLLIGSPTYMSPERLRGEPTGPAADMWSLGATLYSAVEGRPPFRGQTTMGTISAVLADDVPPPRTSGAMRAALLGMLDKDPAHRLRREQIEALLSEAMAAPEPRRPADAQPAAPQQQPPARSEPPLGVGDPPVPSRPRRPGIRPLVAGLALLAVLAAAVAGVLIVQARDSTVGAGGSVGPTGQLRSEGSSGAPASSTPTTAASPTTPTTSAGQPSSTTPGTSAPPSSTGASRPHPSGAQVPAGYRLQRDQLGFQVAVPTGWQRRLAGPTRVDFVSPDGSRFVRIDQRAHALPDAAQAWFDAEPGVAASLPGYHRIRIDPIVYRGWKGADWEFTWDAQGGTIHVLDRGLIIPPKGWALYVSVPDATWPGQGLSLLEAVGRSFRPTS